MKPKKPARKGPGANQLPLGVFVQNAATEGLEFTIKADIAAIYYDAAHPEQRAAMAGYINPLLFKTVEALGRTLQAYLMAITKKDTEGAQVIEANYYKAMALLGNTAEQATLSMMAGGPAFPRLVVAREAPPVVGTYEGRRGIPPGAEHSGLKIVTE